MAKKNAETVKFSSKKCWECLTHLPLKATVCSVCKKKVGKVNKFGIAEKPIDYKAYVICVFAFLLLFVFIWKMFL